MNGFIIITDTMEAAMKRDLDQLRDSLPEEERADFESERHVHRQAIINHFAEHGVYPQIDGVSRTSESAT